MSSKAFIQSLVETPPMPGDDKHFPAPLDRAEVGLNPSYSKMKSAGRDAMLVWIQSEFPGARATGQYTVRFSHNGREYSLRQTSNSVRLLGAVDESFDISLCDRWTAVRLIILAVKHGINRKSPAEAEARRMATKGRVKAGLE